MGKFITGFLVLGLVLGAVILARAEALSDTALLQSKITEAESAAGSAVVGDQPGNYSQMSVFNLEAAIAIARGFNNPAVPQSLVDQAYSNLDAALSAFLNSMVPFPPDTTVPIITLVGDATINLLVGDTYVELGAVTDDGSPVTISGAVDTSVVSTSTITYDATDAAGNRAASVTRTVIVAPAPITEPPVINPPEPPQAEPSSTGEGGGGGSRRSRLSKTATSTPAVLGVYTGTDRAAAIAAANELLDRIVKMFEELKQTGILQ